MRAGEEDTPSSHPVLSYTDQMAASLYDPLLLLGRVLIGSIFVTSGFRKLSEIAVGNTGFVKSMSGRGLPEFLGWLAPPVEFFGGLAIVFGFGTRYAALLILAFTIIATLSSHDYWHPRYATQRDAQFGQFSKNVSMIGGIVLLFLTAGGRFSLDRLLRRKG